MLKRLLRWLLRVLYRFETYNEQELGIRGPVLLLPNHVSWWDWLLLGVCLEDDWRFVTSSAAAELSWVHKRIMINRRTFPVDMNSPYAVKHMAEYLQKGGRLLLFPEGRISTTGSLMKLFDGTGFLIYKTQPKVITAYLRGATRLPFSRNPNRKQWFPKITIHFSGPLNPPRFENISVTEARGRLTEWLRHEMLRQRFDAEMQLGPETVPAAILQTARKRPRKTILQDSTLTEVTYRKLLVGADVLATEWQTIIAKSSPRIGVLLPNVNAMPLVLLSLWFAGKIPAVLNYTTGPAILLACARLAGLSQIITSRTFIERAKLDIKPLESAGIKFVIIEDVRTRLRRRAMIRSLLRVCFRSTLTEAKPEPDDTAVILFTSGSEGDPKGVELTHRNLLANIRQMLAVIDLMDTDRFFNALPLFHSFGLTVGLLLPLLQGAFVFLYLSPLHYRVVPSAFYNLNCTVFFGTNTFLSGYGRKAHPYDFRSLRYLFAGAEKLQESTAVVWMQKFGVRVLEGYGATECSPCVSVNIPMHPKPGTAGQFLPRIEYRLETVEGIGDGRSETGTERSGRLFVRGPNVMKGYLNPEPNAKFQALDAWYDTGDIAKVDSEGFVHILGRLKRFAKVSGEMVSLTAVENCLSNAFPKYGLKFAIAVIAKPDEHKGEKLIAVTNEARLTLEEIRDAVRAHGLGNLAFPRRLEYLHELPHLGTGKINHRELERSIK
jgi:acyl-[acyl-carrier-protein]-phospholipid O-acyltransferase / long-chain-fatty-acid--[acyl-carrier-protein] ligase